MITTFLVEHAWITTVTLVMTVLLGPAIGYWLAARPRWAIRLGLVSLLPIAALTLTPTSRDLSVGCTAEWAFPTLGAVEPMANLALFVPAVLLLGVSVRRPFLVMSAASAAAALIELLQAFATALGRSCSTNDWLSNTLGAALGALIAASALWLRRSRARPRLE